MPSGTTIQQFVNDLRDRKSTIAHKFDKVYNYCKIPGNVSYKTSLVTALEDWIPGNAATLPDLAPAADNLNDAEKAHISEWSDAGKVKNAMLNALNDGRDIEFFWDLNDEPTVTESKSVIVPAEAGDPLPGPGGAGNITVTFLTPRSNVSRRFPTILGITIGGINVEV